MPKPLLVYLIIMNIIGFILMGTDKNRAVNYEWRIPEAALFGVSIAGGALGSLIGMYFFRHKTKHASFVVGIPVIMIIWFIIVIRVSVH